MSGAIIAPALPDISAFFDGSAPQVYIKLVLTMPAISIVMFSALIGVLADRLGRKNILLVSLLIFGVSGVSGAFINDIYLLLFSRFILGIGVAGIMNAATAMVGDYFQDDMRARFLGLQASFMAIGGIVYLNLGGILAEISWRGPFYIYAFSLVVLPLAFIFLPKLTTASKRNNEIDTPVISKAKKSAFMVFGMGFLGMLFFYLVPVQLPFLLKENFDASNTFIGFIISLATMAGAVASVAYKKFTRRFTSIRIYGITFLLVGLGYFLVSIALIPFVVVLGLMLTGFGIGLMMPNGNLILLALLPAAVRGRWLGGLTTAMFLGQFLSPVIVTPISGYWSIEIAFMVVAVISTLISVYLLTTKTRLMH